MLRATKDIPGVNWIGLWTIIRRETVRITRSPVAFVAPWISALMFILIFGQVIGQSLADIGGHRYLEFVLPGIVMMNIVSVSFAQSSGQVYYSRFQHYIEEALIAPLSYAEMITGALAVVVVRSAVTALGIVLMAAAFGVTTIAHIGAFLFWTVMVSGVFALLGMVVGLWARNFEQLTVFNVFVITPLSFIGGVFNTTAMLPGWLRNFAWFNPFFYFTNGLRNAMIGFHEGPSLVGPAFTTAAVCILALIVWRLYVTGWGIRE